MNRDKTLSAPWVVGIKGKDSHNLPQVNGEVQMRTEKRWSETNFPTEGSYRGTRGTRRSKTKSVTLRRRPLTFFPSLFLVTGVTVRYATFTDGKKRTWSRRCHSGVKCLSRNGKVPILTFTEECRRPGPLEVTEDK